MWQQNVELTAKLNWFMEQFRLNQRRRFDRSSGQTIPEQISLFNKAEAEAKPDLEEPTVEEITYKHKKKNGKREAQLKDLPVETIEYSLPEEEQVCSCCGGALHEMGTEVRQELKVTPARVSAVKHLIYIYIYACHQCEHEEINTPITTAPMPKPVIPGSLASPSAMAYIVQNPLTAEVLYGILSNAISRWRGVRAV
ncbi:MAG: hypothetical protein HPY70_07125 [Firmicutes bacterium]|nr:hypothetical protein [Bacillota bacterium]